MDSYRTIKALAEGTYSEKRSKFLAFAMPVSSVDEVKLLVADYQKKYYDARHVCYAYMLGAERLEFVPTTTVSRAVRRVSPSWGKSIPTN